MNASTAAGSVKVQDFIRERIRSFRPAWWAPGAHAQSILGRFLRGHRRVFTRRERLELPDGDFLDLDFLLPVRDVRTLHVILHGLEGSAEAPYIRSLLEEFSKRGENAVAVNFRSCSGEPNRTLKTYHSGKSEDLDAVLEYLSEKLAVEKFCLTGYSIGGNIVLKWLGEHGGDAVGRIHRAAAVSVPYDLVKSVEVMDQGFNREVYTRTLLNALKTKVLLKAEAFPAAFDLKAVRRCRTFSDFDELVTAPVNNFRNARHYWETSSSIRYLERIRIPTLLIHAADDPFFPGTLLPESAIRSAGCTSLLMTEKGGHLGFLTGKWPWRPEKWLETVLIDYLNWDNGPENTVISA